MNHPTKEDAGLGEPEYVVRQGLQLLLGNLNPAKLVVVLLMLVVVVVVVVVVVNDKLTS